MTDRADDASALDPLLDFFVYAPIGMIYEYPEVLDTLVKRGKSQVQLAKLLGQVARGTDPQAGPSIEDGLTMAATLVEKVMNDVGAAIATAVGVPDNTPAPQQAPDNTPAPEPAPEAAPSSEEALPIANYDSLKAKEVIGLLADLSAAQRQRVLAYEQTHKARKTIVSALTSS